MDVNPHDYQSLLPPDELNQTTLYLKLGSIHSNVLPRSVKRKLDRSKNREEVNKYQKMKERTWLD
jgi:hypothetical protein